MLQRILLIIISFILMFSLSSCALLFDENLGLDDLFEENYEYTDDLADYQTKIAFMVDSRRPVFPSQIPDGVEATFSYCCYYGDSDIYLEMKFSNVEEMEAYLNERKGNMKAYSEQPNIYDNSYTDIFPYPATVSKADDRFYFYEVEEYEDSPGTYRFWGSWHVISYSYDALTVVTTCFDIGNPFTLIIPRYFHRFNIPIPTSVYHYQPAESTDPEAT